MIAIEQGLLIGILVIAVVLLLASRLRPDLVALLVLALLPLTGTVTYAEALSGFSRSVVITILGLFIITQAVEDSGVVDGLATRLRHLSGGSESRLILVFMGAGALLSLLMNNIAAGAVLLPAAVQVGREARVPASRLLMPLAFGTLVGGMATYFTTANIILSGVLRDHGQRGLELRDFLPTGGLIVVASLGFMAFLGRRWLPERESAAQQLRPRGSSRELYDTYELGTELWEARLGVGSPLIGSTLAASRLGETLGLRVLAVWRGQEAILNPSPSLQLARSDLLLVQGTAEALAAAHELGLEPGRPAAGSEVAPRVDLTEIVIPPRSRLVGKTLTEVAFRNRYGLTAVALWRHGESYRSGVGALRLDVGDALLLVGSPEEGRRLAEETDFLVLHQNDPKPAALPGKRGLTAAIAGLVLLVSILGLLPTSQAMLLGVAALALTGCINLDDAYRAIDWRVIFLIAGLLPLSIAMSNSGLADRLGHALLVTLAPLGSYALVSGLFFITLAFTLVVGGQVAALLLGPVAVQAALAAGVDPRATAVAVAIACSAAFLTPIAHPVNLLVMGPGGYQPRDFLKPGLGMTAVTFLTLLAGLALFWGL